MALTPDQERDWFAQLEALSVSQVRSDLEGGKTPPAFVHATAAWLSAKDKEPMNEERLPIPSKSHLRGAPLKQPSKLLQKHIAPPPRR
jgi:hypothetical protein